MTTSTKYRLGTAVVLIAVLIGALVTVWPGDGLRRITVEGYFANSNGIFVGDEVRILGVTVGKIESIEPQATRVKIRFSYPAKYEVPADAKAVILSPSLVTARAIQLTPAYTGGPLLEDGAVIPEERTAVPVEWDDFREQLERLTETLQPTEAGGVSTLGSYINTAADNVRGQGADIRNAVVQLAQAFSMLGDHSDDVFSTVENLSVLVSALTNSTDLMRYLNQNIASVTGLLANDPDEVSQAVRNLNSVVADVGSFVADNRETIGTTTDKLASVSQALHDSLDDIKQTLHLTPNVFQNFLNIYQPAQGTMSSALVITNFADPIGFICGAVQAASRLGAEQSAKLCAQYLAPIVKNRQYNFPPIGENLFVGPAARPNEITYSEDWLRPDYIPPNNIPPNNIPPNNIPPNDSLESLMLPSGSGS
ncbi:Mce family protein Mce3D [Mycolicibacterium chitae]|uniref:Virulence factor Mce family protein n=1 Tax=Mycolicibacterium chitae TaxID=1792 RepID=A0A448I7Y8_MYCCI|nr:MCE family protein [Mycolicibacterium chitae]BBZ04808.1 Mce family protein Mce3D [Mycolicibacterium chitae]VEG48434.1 virulence factor Mce family protein [Mycolicibacterium chitae]